MAGTLANTNKVPVWVCFGTAGAEVNLGFCNPGDITLTVNEEWSEQMFHQTGTYLNDAYFNGARATVTCELAETESLDTWAAAFGFGEKQEDAATPPNTRFAFNTIDTVNAQFDIGTKASTLAKSLLLIPQAVYVTASTENADNIVLPKAWVRNVGDILFSVENNCVLPVTFEALFDASSTTGGNLLFRGKKTATGAWAAA